VVLIPFYFGFVAWYSPSEPFQLQRALWTPDGSGVWSFLTTSVAWHLLGVALPEEAFFRGYLQTAVDDRSASFWTLGGRRFGWSIILVSGLFALGHFATSPHPARLAVFFPSVLFGVVRTSTGGIGAAVVLHAECNLFSQLLGQGHGLY
jgi:membrane protease YdiL (CAAX protease family)